MKTSILSILILAALSVVLPAHESITFGPNGGKLVALDSPATPSAEVVVKESQFIVGLFDKSKKPIALGVIETGAGDQAALEGCQRSSHWWLARRTRSCAIASALAASHAVPPFLSRAWSTCLCPDSMSPLPMGNSRSIAAG